MELFKYFDLEFFRDLIIGEYIMIFKSVKLVELFSFGKFILFYDIKFNGSIVY